MSNNIMVVDDDVLLLKVIKTCLMHRGYTVRTFDTGSDAVKSLFEEKPDAVVLDIRLPDCDGWFIARLLERLYSGNKIQLIIISVMDEDSSKLLEVKPFAYIQKPFDIGKLLETVEKSMNYPQEIVKV